MKKKVNEIKYTIPVGQKKLSDIMRRLDLGLDGITQEKLIATVTTTSKITPKLIEGHKEALRLALSDEYYVGEITYELPTKP